MADHQFYERVKGPMDNYEDWYSLKNLPDGSQEIQHSWSYVTPKLKSDSGSKTYSVTGFLESNDVDANAVAALRNFLG